MVRSHTTWCFWRDKELALSFSRYLLLTKEYNAIGLVYWLRCSMMQYSRWGSKVRDKPSIMCGSLSSRDNGSPKTYHSKTRQTKTELWGYKTISASKVLVTSLSFEKKKETCLSRRVVTCHLSPCARPYFFWRSIDPSIPSRGPDTGEEKRDPGESPKRFPGEDFVDRMTS